VSSSAKESATKPQIQMSGTGNDLCVTESSRQSGRLSGARRASVAVQLLQKLGLAAEDSQETMSEGKKSGSESSEDVNSALAAAKKASEEAASAVHRDSQAPHVYFVDAVVAVLRRCIIKEDDMVLINELRHVNSLCKDAAVVERLKAGFMYFGFCRRGPGNSRSLIAF